MLGAIPSAADYRDKIAAAAVVMPASALPSSFHTDLGADLYQQDIPACVSHSITYLIRRWWFENHGEWIDFSPRFLDILSAESWIPLNGGRVPRTVLKVAANRGICTTKTLPNDTSLSISKYRDPKAITAAAYAEAEKYKIPGYISIGIDFDSTRKGIFHYGALSSLYQVGQELWIPSWLPKDTDPLRTPAAVVSGHQMSPCGWKDAALNTLRNQWSKAWANNDETHYDPIAWRPFTTEQWAIAQISGDVAAFLQDLPSPASFHYNFSVSLVQGMANESVKMLQVALMILGFLDVVKPDELGIFGPKTAAAVGKFQASRGISPVPGSVGPLTRTQLNSIFAI